MEKNEDGGKIKGTEEKGGAEEERVKNLSSCECSAWPSRNIACLIQLAFLHGNQPRLLFSFTSLF